MEILQHIFLLPRRLSHDDCYFNLCNILIILFIWFSLYFFLLVAYHKLTCRKMLYRMSKTLHNTLFYWNYFFQECKFKSENCSVLIWLIIFNKFTKKGNNEKHWSDLILPKYKTFHSFFGRIPNLLNRINMINDLFYCQVGMHR